MRHRETDLTAFYAANERWHARKRRDLWIGFGNMALVAAARCRTPTWSPRLKPGWASRGEIP